MNKIIVTGNDLSGGQYGGVKNFTEKLLQSYTPTVNALTYFSLGANPNWHFDNKNMDQYSYRANLITKYFFFIISLCDKKVKLVHVNTGMSRNSILRDLPLILISSILSKRRVTFFHGWKDREFVKIKNSLILTLILKYILNCSQTICVLSSQFRRELINFGVPSSKIFRLTTMVDTKYYNQKSEFLKVSHPVNILFCSQPLRKEKGIFEFAGSIDDLLHKYPNIRIRFLGEYDSVRNLKEEFESDNYKGKVEFLGFKEGEEKINVFRTSHILILPSYTEGLPSTVLEAMAGGLCIISTEVGGLRDILCNGLNGIILEMPPTSSNIRNCIKTVLDNEKLLTRIRKTNYIQSRQKFDTKVVSRRMEIIYNHIIKC